MRSIWTWLGHWLSGRGGEGTSGAVVFRDAAGTARRHETRASQIMRRLNRHALILEQGRVVYMVEDFSDSDGRLFRLEYQATPDGRRAIAFCRFNPWGAGGDMHLYGDGQICLGRHGIGLQDSPFDLDTAVRRARFWCVAVSVYHETGSFPNV
ncbi:MAG: hypothetical protein GXY58_03690 [Planctomycetaceae bacterium]|nr:hypothetical protein [Planctomycetaceae bacterium]